MRDIYRLGPWAALFLVLGLLFGILFGVAAASFVVTITQVVILVCVLVLLLGRNRRLRWRLIDTLIVLVGFLALGMLINTSGNFQPVSLWVVPVLQVLLCIVILVTRNNKS